MDIAELRFVGAVWLAANKNDKTELLELLRSAYPLTEEDKLYLADYIEGKFTKRRLKGRPKKNLIERRHENLAIVVAADDVAQMKRIWKILYNRTFGAHERAIQWAAARRGVDENKLANYLNRPRGDRRRL